MKGWRLWAFNILIGPFLIVGLILADLAMLALLPAWIARKFLRERRYGMAAMAFFGWYAPVFLLLAILSVGAIRQYRISN
jgi:hypothetical protein